MTRLTIELQMIGLLLAPAVVKATSALQETCSTFYEQDQVITAGASWDTEHSKYVLDYIYSWNEPYGEGYQMDLFLGANDAFVSWKSELANCTTQLEKWAQEQIQKDRSARSSAKSNELAVADRSDVAKIIETQALSYRPLRRFRTEETALILRERARDDAATIKSSDFIAVVSSEVSSGTLKLAMVLHQNKYVPFRLRLSSRLPQKRKNVSLEKLRDLVRRTRTASDPVEQLILYGEAIDALEDSHDFDWEKATKILKKDRSVRIATLWFREIEIRMRVNSI
ncbi:hypothetical protein FOL47_002432 [Perkinsus chesapeaki]|uniref:Uncharacterized protein n=1 Tax=Perkinsus chesapeaki TaxID=330153 RepID=A0A7J6MDW1_PERCH|nr:hypothetical protein FOL47_002432 [Perkinsus chesapeaki]